MAMGLCLDTLIYQVPLTIMHSLVRRTRHRYLPFPSLTHSRLPGHDLQDESHHLHAQTSSVISDGHLNLQTALISTARELSRQTARHRTAPHPLQEHAMPYTYPKSNRYEYGNAGLISGIIAM